ncbi:regulator of sigma E protease [Scopulibacillus darangshiensis]|uniref:Zinc metalloprotease n=1 Tax=Scopulibacillus darangshiensis TaxID=442528 RepID=A0A4R2P603_9BACL|nr:RIP metalloprotease RseP [Scopulibacillus darangshiensis]TCP30299.1 regulator of sigma E protease [Scopulibacillus darangshiensis]
METFISVVIIFGLLISFHEFGHLLLAKRAGILCREFAIGFGPKLFSIKKGETVYTLRLLPIGGFVRMAGEDPEIIEIKPGHRVGLMFNNAGLVNKIIINKTAKYPQAKMVTVEHADLEKDLLIKGYEQEDGELISYPLDRKADYVVDEQGYQIAPLDRQFGSKSLLDRFLAIFAGPFMNFLLAFIVFIIYFSIQGVPSDAPKLGKLVQGDPAAKAGLHQGDRVIKIDDHTIDSWKDIMIYVNQHPSEELSFTIERNNHIRHVDVTTNERKSPEGGKEGFMGVYAPTEESFIGTIKGGVTQTYFFIKQELIGIKMLVTGAVGLDQLAGPVGIYNITGKVVNQGFLLLLNWTAVLSINLGIINLLPLPALDGGRILFLIVEGLRGKPVDPQRETLVHFIGFALLMLLMIVVTWNDIQKIFLQ